MALPFDSVVLMPCIHNRQSKFHSKCGASPVSCEHETCPGKYSHLAPVGNRQLTTPTIGSNHTRCSKVTDVHFRECAVIRANARLSREYVFAGPVQGPKSTFFVRRLRGVPNCDSGNQF